MLTALCGNYFTVWLLCNFSSEYITLVQPLKNSNNKKSSFLWHPHLKSLRLLSRPSCPCLLSHSSTNGMSDGSAFLCRKDNAFKPAPPMEKMRSALLDPLTPPASVSVPMIPSSTASTLFGRFSNSSSPHSPSLWKREGF